eukprot:g663.t1
MNFEQTSRMKDLFYSLIQFSGSTNPNVLELEKIDGCKELIKTLAIMDWDDDAKISLEEWLSHFTIMVEECRTHNPLVLIHNFEDLVNRQINENENELDETVLSPTLPESPLLKYLRKKSKNSDSEDGDNKNERLATAPSLTVRAQTAPIQISKLRSLQQVKGKRYRGLLHGTPVSVHFFPFEETKSCLKEAQFLSLLSHPNIIRLMGVSSNSDRNETFGDIQVPSKFIVTELCTRGSLFSVLENERRKEDSSKQLFWVRRIDLAIDMARVISFLHNQTPPLMHRSINSHNFLVSSHWQVKLSNFETAKSQSQEPLLTQNVGNVLWRAPEVMTGTQYDVKCDIYSLGVVFWELSTLKQPWYEVVTKYEMTKLTEQKIKTSVVEHNKRPILPKRTEGVPEAFIRLIERCWSQDSNWRPRADEIVSILVELQEKLTGKSISSLMFEGQETEKIVYAIQDEMRKEKEAEIEVLHQQLEKMARKFQLQKTDHERKIKNLEILHKANVESAMKKARENALTSHMIDETYSPIGGLYGLSPDAVKNIESISKIKSLRLCLDASEQKVEEILKYVEDEGEGEELN